MGCCFALGCAHTVAANLVQHVNAHDIAATRTHGPRGPPALLKDPGGGFKKGFFLGFFDFLGFLRIF